MQRLAILSMHKIILAGEHEIDFDPAEDIEFFFLKVRHTTPTPIISFSKVE